jgi:hypothetical protein
MIMSQRRRVVRFAMSNKGNEPDQVQVMLAPERGIESSHVGVWIVIATVLWSLIAIPTLVI